MKMNRWNISGLTVTICFLFTVGMLAGCSKPPEGEDGKASMSSPPETIPATAGESAASEEEKFGC